MNPEKKKRIFPTTLNYLKQKFQFLGETRNLILFWYLFIMITFVGLSIPIFSELVLQEVEISSQKELIDKGIAFEEYLRQRQLKQGLVTKQDIRDFFKDIFNEQIPDDDIFLIAIVGGEFYDSSPQALPEIIEVNSELMQYWLNLTHEKQTKYITHNSAIGDVIYLAKPVVSETKLKGVFVVANVTGGEIKEAKTFIWIVVRVLLAVLLLALILTWIASGKILSPLRSLISTVKIISDDNLDQRLPIQGTGEMAELAKTFNEMMNRLKQSFITQRAFINDAGHELRTPITIIRGHLELLGDDPQEQEETLTLVFDELDRMSRMVEDLLLLAKSEQPNFLHPETIDLSVFVEEIFTKAHTLAPRNWQLKSLATGIIRGDRHRLTQGIMNLVKNATEHTREGDLIEIGSQIRGNYLYLWVRDTGEGIIESEQERIFQRFARVENHQRRSDGFGLGLSIVKGIAEAHRGRVQVISQLGTGSTFMLIIPSRGV